MSELISYVSKNLEMLDTGEKTEKGRNHSNWKHLSAILNNIGPKDQKGRDQYEWFEVNFF